MPPGSTHRRQKTTQKLTTRAKVKPPPAYRRRNGYDQAIVTLTDFVTKKRRDYWLGLYGSSESRELYFRLIAEWEAGSRRLPQLPSSRRASRDDHDADTDQAPSVNRVIRAYWQWVKLYYSPSERATQHAALRLLRKLFGSLRASEFGPNRLRLLRDEMVRGDATADPPRRPWSRKHVNGQVHRVCAMFKWAASHEMLPASVYQQLKTVTSLKRGRTPAREPSRVEPVAIELVRATQAFLSRQVNALIDLQLYSGARGGELFKLRPIDINMNDRGGIWTITPDDHKTAHHGHSRTIFLGPKAQQVIEPFLADRPVDAHLFSPAEAEAERLAARSAARTTPLSSGNVPGSNKVEKRMRPPDEFYTAASYRRAISRACERAFPFPEPNSDSILGLSGVADVRAKKELLAEAKRQWTKAHHWHPHQLRHTAATLIRREFGLEAARIVLGHSSALVTEAIYAERDMEQVASVMRKIG